MFERFGITARDRRNLLVVAVVIAVMIVVVTDERVVVRVLSGIVGGLIGGAVFLVTTILIKKAGLEF